MYRKSGCIVEKHRFYSERLKFTLKTTFSIEEILYIENPVVSLKKDSLLQGNTEILN